MSATEAMNFAATLPVGGNRRSRVIVLNLDTGEVLRKDEAICARDLRAPE
jgi:hypothetical protein